MVKYTNAFIKKFKDKKSEVILSGSFKNTYFDKSQEVAVIDKDELDTLIKAQNLDDVEQLIRENKKLKEENEYASNKIDEYKKIINSKDEDIFNLINKVESLRENESFEDGAYFEHKYMDTLEYVDQLKDEINYHNQLLFNVHTNISEDINKIIDEVITQANDSVEEIFLNNNKNLDEELKQIGVNLTKHNRCVDNNIQNEIKIYNKKLKNASIWDLIFHRDDFEFSVDTNDLRDEISPKIKTAYNIIETPKININPTNVKKKYDFSKLNELWIESRRKINYENVIIDASKNSSDD